VTPTLSEAFAETDMVPETVALFVGLVMLVVGGVVSGGGMIFAALVVPLTLCDWALVFPAASYAETV
jgi:hypothetical protein